MSTYDFITTNDLSKILLAMFDHPAFKNSLSIAGKDGTLKYRFRNSPLDGRIKGKTGYVSGVRALSGYLQTKSNNTLIFSLLTNNYTVKTRYVDDAEASILTVLYNHY
jgi:D-alanyl-D-alanine carboxypeptidase/D-alanyl-D-alanine-endopeptidase (penicillin-binding protein 4)